VSFTITFMNEKPAMGPRTAATPSRVAWGEPRLLCARADPAMTSHCGRLGGEPPGELRGEPPPPHAELVRPEIPGSTSYAIIAGKVVHDTSDRERPARTLRRPCPEEEPGPIVKELYPPGLSDNVGVDLELHFDPAVLGAELEFPIRGPAAHASADDVALLPQSVGGGSEQTDDYAPKHDEPRDLVQLFLLSSVRGAYGTQ
jgi:hypothetical protein